MTSNYSVEFPPLRHLVFGGDGIQTFNLTASCTAGFWVLSRLNSTPYIMTAGHCSKLGPFNPDGSVDFYHLPWGTIEGNQLIGPMAPPNISVIDKGLILKQNDSIGVIPSVRNTDDIDMPELKIIGTVDLDTVGSVVCKSGYVSHISCGVVLSLHTKVFQGGRLYGGIAKVSMMPCRGDSGSPVFPLVPDLFPGIFITGMLTSRHVAKGYCVVVPIDMLITDDIYVLTINDLISSDNNFLS
ncbi:hypothetical protein C2G38_1638835 [Gigaspora rosea]|uniref:Trypsin-like cysteine/serine peptidase domain-containing protein n=1 Tax=Gigaspora rosea TaxID=44941 RepID=A0A397W3U6_9GLOM|nr:hypothetical protein C2G38_1638835 [Gigaspora rosea]